MNLIIAEKPELGRDIARALIGNDYKEKESVIQNDEWTIVWAYGHILELVEPSELDEKYNEWKMEDLPIYFNNWKKRPSTEEYKKKRCKQIGDLLKNADMVVHAGDPDDEGQNLVDEILDYFQYDGEVKRVYLNDNLPENIQKEFKNFVSNQEARRNGDVAYGRQMADKAFGINHSRLANLKLNTKGLSMGRVQIPTLGLVVNRDQAIANHIKQKYYELQLILDEKDSTNAKIAFDFVPDKDLCDDGNHILNKDVFASVINHFKEKDMTAITSTSEKSESVPLPFNQTELASEMNKKYGYSVKKTLDITQNLRDKYHAITYNRTDSRYLKEEHYQMAPQTVHCVLSNISVSYSDDLNLSIHSRAFDDAALKGEAHHAIIPQAIEFDTKKLTEEELNVYKAICERYLMQFLPDYKAKVYKTIINIANGQLVYKQSICVDKGWKQFFQTDSNKVIDENIVFDRGEHHMIYNSHQILEKETKPLKKYTQGSLIKDMSSIAKYVNDPKVKQALLEKDKEKKDEKGSIGTVATRPAIIETLLQRKYIQEEGKHIVSTELGREFYNIIPDELKSADITANWWIIQEKIRNGESDVNAVMKDVIDQFNRVKDTAYQGKQLTVDLNKKISYGKCPKCGGDIYKGKNNWYCSNYKDGCDFALFKNFKRFNDVITLTDASVKKLLQGKTIKAVLTKKDGGKYKANLKLKINGQYLNLEIDSFAK